MLLAAKFFRNRDDLVKFVNKHGIMREQIECITQVEFGFTMFFWYRQR